MGHMRRPKDAPLITYIRSDERADLAWIISMLVRWTLDTPPDPPADCNQPAGASTNGQATDGIVPRRAKTRPPRTTT